MHDHANSFHIHTRHFDSRVATEECPIDSEAFEIDCWLVLAAGAQLTQEQLGKPSCLTLEASASPCCCRQDGCEPGIVWVKAGSFPLQRSSSQCSSKGTCTKRFPVVNLMLDEEVSTTLKSSLLNT